LTKKYFLTLNFSTKHFRTNCFYQKTFDKNRFRPENILTKKIKKNSSKINFQPKRKEEIKKNDPHFHQTQL